MIHLWITRSDIQREATWPPNRQSSLPKSMRLDIGRPGNDFYTLSEPWGRENYAAGASEIDIPIKDQTWSGCFVERIRGSDHGSSIGVVDFLYAFINSVKKL